MSLRWGKLPFLGSEDEILDHKCQIEKAVDELNLTRKIISCHPSNLPYGKKTHLRFRGREVYPTEGSCRFPLIVLQQTTQSFLATHNSVVLCTSSQSCPAVKSTTSCGYVHTTEPISCVCTRTGFAAKGVASLAFVLKWILIFPIHRGSRRRVRRGSTHLTRFLHSSFQLSRG